MYEVQNTPKDIGTTLKNHFKWHQTAYVPVYDKNENIIGSHKKEGKYPSALVSDQFVRLEPPRRLQHKEPPQRIMIVTPSSHAVDLILDKLSPIADRVKIRRLGQSLTRKDLNTKYALDVPIRNDGTSFDKVQGQIEKAQILISATFSLRQHILEKSPHQFDTVIFDDAGLINETDCLAALRHGANRAILIGNREIDQGMFLLNPPQVNKSMFYRVQDFVHLPPVSVPVYSSQPKVASP